jgi:hypothetical protein
VTRNGAKSGGAASQGASGTDGRDNFHAADGDSDRRFHRPRLRVGGRDPSGSPPRRQEPAREDPTPGTSRDRTGHDVVGPCESRHTAGATSDQ